MHTTVEWVKPADRVIVQEIGRYGGWIKPATLSLNLELSQPHIQRRCKTLAEHGVLDRHDDVVAYRLADLGQRWLLGQATPQELQAAGRL